LQKINVTFEDKGVLTIKEWINMTRERAEADAVKLQVTLNEQQVHRLSEELETLPETRLNSYIVNQLGLGEDGLNSLNNTISINWRYTPIT
jgi:hypothetical protein